MLRRITSLLRRVNAGQASEAPCEALRLAPASPFIAVGDIHGRSDLLTQMLAQIDVTASSDESRVFLGDYIDRGPQSKQVLIQLFERQREAPEQFICLKGNHEQMMLDFIDDPAGTGQHWLQAGGVETLASFGIALPRKQLDSSTLLDLADALEIAMPAGLQAWLRQLPLRWSSGNLHCVHAAMSPKRAVEDQRTEVLLWGHPHFMHSPRDDEQFIVHGHTIVKQAGVFPNRIALDTGAFRTGRLSAARISAGICEFFEVRD